MDKNKPAAPLSREEETMSAVSLLTAVTHDADEDFTLPDYMPQIRRVVSVTAVPLPENRFLTGAALEFGGTLAYSVLYIGENNELFCAPLTSEYSGSAALGEAAVSDANAVGLDTSAENVTCRVTGPRRLTLKCRMKTKLTSFEGCAVADHVKESSGARLTAEDESALQRRIERAPDCAVSRGEVTATAGGALNIGSGAKVIACSGAVRVEEVRAAGGSVSVRGDVILNALCLSGDGTFFRSGAKAPLAESVPLPDAGEGDCVRAWGRSASVTVNAGEDNNMTWEIEYDLEAEAIRPLEKQYTADVYSTACTCVPEFGDTDSLRLLRCGIGGISVSGEGGRQNKPVPGEYIVDVDAVASPDHVECLDKRLILHGVCAVRVLIAGEEVVSEEFTLPFRYETEAAEQPQSQELLSRCAAEVTGASARLDGDKIAVNLDVNVSMSVFSREKIHFVRTAVLNKSETEARNEDIVRVFYPDPGEPLWDICKKYRISHRALCEMNCLAEDTQISDGTPILV